MDVNRARLHAPRVTLCVGLGVRKSIAGSEGQLAGVERIAYWLRGLSIRRYRQHLLFAYLALQTLQNRRQRTPSPKYSPTPNSLMNFSWQARMVKLVVMRFRGMKLVTMALACVKLVATKLGKAKLVRLNLVRVETVSLKLVGL